MCGGEGSGNSTDRYSVGMRILWDMEMINNECSSDYFAIRSCRAAGEELKMLTVRRGMEQGQLDRVM